MPTRAGREWWRPPISLVLLFGFGGLVAGAVAAVLLLALDIAERNTNELLRQTAELSIDLAVQSLAYHLDPARSQLEFLARQLSTGDFPLDDDGRLQDLLLGSLAAAPQITGVAFVSDDLHAVRAGREAGVYDAGSGSWIDRPEVRLALRNAPSLAGFEWGDVLYFERLGNSYITLRNPVRRGGRFSGVVVAIVSISELSNFLAATTPPLGGRVFVLRGRDEVIAHPAMTGASRGLSPAKPLPRLDEVGDPVLAAMWQQPVDTADEIFAGSSVASRIIDTTGDAYDFDNAHIFLYREIGSYGPVPWLVGIYFRLSDVNQPLLRLVFAAGVGGAILLGALVIALLLGRSLAAPIRRLAVAADAIRDLRVDEVPPLKDSLYRELHRATRAYNAMLVGLRWFETYVPRALVLKLMRQEQAELAFEERFVTVLFTDIAGFSEITDRLPAPQLAEFLNRHFGMLTGCIEAEEGTIDKYIGDSVMAFWGAPFLQPDHAQRACRAARAIAETLRADNERRLEKGLRPVRLRIGIATGAVVVGNVGAPGRINYTLIGDTVNIAQRLEQLAKTFDLGSEEAIILISDDTAKALGGDIITEPLGSQELRGLAKPLDVYRIF